MKKSDRKLPLHRETLKRLGDASLTQAAGGIFTKQPQPPVPTNTCTFTCAGCLGE